MLDTASRAARLLALVVLGGALTACASRAPQETLALAQHPEAVVFGEAQSDAFELDAVTRSLNEVEPGQPAAWTVVETNSVGSARLIEATQDAPSCRSAEILRMTAKTLDELTAVFCLDDDGLWRAAGPLHQRTSQML